VNSEQEVVETSEVQSGDGDDEITTVTKKVRIAVSPLDVLKKVLGEDKFDPIRDILNDPTLTSYLELGRSDTLQKVRLIDSTLTMNHVRGRGGRGGGGGRGVVSFGHLNQGGRGEEENGRKPVVDDKVTGEMALLVCDNQQTEF